GARVAVAVNRGSVKTLSNCPELIFFFFQAEDGIRDFHVTGVQTCALPISTSPPNSGRRSWLIHLPSSPWPPSVDSPIQPCRPAWAKQPDPSNSARPPSRVSV